MKPIVKCRGEYYRQDRPVGSKDCNGWRHYALWTPVRRFLFWWVPVGASFWLEPFGDEV
jgi:hypothetical protein